LSGSVRHGRGRKERGAPPPALKTSPRPCALGQCQKHRGVARMAPATRKESLLIEARRKRISWVEAARDGSGLGADGHASHWHRVDPAAKMLESTKAGSALPSSPALVQFLADQLDPTEAEIVADAHAVQSDIPIPTHDSMPDATSYQVLLEKLKHPSAAEVVKMMERFIDQMERQGVSSLDDASTTISAFLERLHAQMRESPLWLSETDAQWDSSKVSVESFLFRKLHHVFFPSSPEAVEQDRDLERRLRSLAFIDAAHLDIKSLQQEYQSSMGQPSNEAREDEMWQESITCLRKMSAEYGPTAKIDQVVRCSKSIASVLTTAMRGKLPGADDFLPAMILVVKKANPSRLHSNLTFIQTFAPQHRLLSEAGYIFTHLSSAVAFLQDVDANALTITSEEFEAGIQRSQEQARRDMALAVDLRRRSSSLGAESEFDAAMAPRPVKDRYAAVDVQLVRQARTQLSPPDAVLGLAPPKGAREQRRGARDLPSSSSLRARYRYATAKPENVTFGDIRTLLKDYKELVGLCEVLLEEKERAASVAATAFDVIGGTGGTTRRAAASSGGRGVRGP